MSLSARGLRRAVAGAIGIAPITAATLFGSASLAFAQPPPAPPGPGCTAADLAHVSGIVGTAMGDYMFTHPDVNNFFTSLRGLPNEEIRGDVRSYMDANPRVESEINGIRQPLTDLRNRCDAPAPTALPGAPLGPP